MRRPVIALSLLTALAGSALAGPINPPAGPVGSTGKTLTEVEPRTAVNAVNTPGSGTFAFVITQPGSYYLTGNVTSNLAALSIQASNVTLDLNGFTLKTTGTNACLNITSDNVVVRNGRIESTNSSGIGATVNCDAFTLEGLEVTVPAALNVYGITWSNSTSGVCTVRQCRIKGGHTGFYTSAITPRCTLTDVEVSGSLNHGIVAADRAVIERCTVRDIAIAGAATGYGIYGGSMSVIRDCQVLDNGSANGPDRGIRADISSVVENCVVSSTGGGRGIHVTGSGAVVRNNRVTMHQGGAAIDASVGASDTHITDNFLRLPTGIGTGVALGATTGCLVVRNHISSASTPITGTALGNNIIGPGATNGNPTVSSNPHANFIN